MIWLQEKNDRIKVLFLQKFHTSLVYFIPSLYCNPNSNKLNVNAIGIENLLEEF